jgi:hypothetical protein
MSILQDELENNIKKLPEELKKYIYEEYIETQLFYDNEKSVYVIRGKRADDEYLDYEPYNFNCKRKTIVENFIKNMYESNCSEWGHLSSENYKKFTEEVILNWEIFK